MDDHEGNIPDVEKRLPMSQQRLLSQMREGVIPPGFDPTNEEEFERLTPPLPEWVEFIKQENEKEIPIQTEHRPPDSST